MIEDQPGRGESEEAEVIRERSLKEHEHSGRETTGEAEEAEEAEVTGTEDKLEEKQPERGSDRRKEQPGRGSDQKEEQPGRGESGEAEVIREKDKNKQKQD
jgi:hypothetical protein